MSEGGTSRWPRDLFAEAVWSSNLPAPARLVALAYADHARDAEVAWVAPARLQERTGLGRTASRDALKLLVAQGWLVLEEKARQHQSARYRLVAQGAVSRPSEGVVSRPSGDPGGRLPAPGGRLADSRGSSPDPDLSSLPQDQDHSRTREEVGPVIVTAEDRQPDSSAALADRLRGHGVDWSDRDVDEVRRRLVGLLGGDVRAEGQAAGALVALAQIVPTHRVRNLGAWARVLTDEDLLDHRIVAQVLGAPARRSGPVRVVDQAALDSAKQRALRLEEHELGAAARAEARRVLGADAAATRIDLEAELLVADPTWRLDQRDVRLRSA